MTQNSGADEKSKTGKLDLGNLTDKIADTNHEAIIKKAFEEVEKMQ